MSIDDKINILNHKSTKRAKVIYDDLEIISDSSVESDLADANTQKNHNLIETPIYLNKLNSGKTESDGLSFRSFFVVNDHIFIENSFWRAKHILFSSYIIDVDWVLDEIKDIVLKHENTESVLFISHNCEDFKKYKFKHFDKRIIEKVSVFSPNQKIPYGVYHPKFNLIVFEHLTQPKKSFIRFIITSANLTQQDWEFKSQSIWVQDFFLSNTNNNCEFLEYLHNFLKNVLNGSKLEEFWLSKIREFNFEDATAKLVASIPGYFIGRDMTIWGHLRVKALINDVLKSCGKLNSYVKEERIVLQFSSIGRISERWLNDEFISSLSDTPETKLEIIFPTVEHVINSLEGIEGGISLPVKKEYIYKPCITKLLHKFDTGNMKENASYGKAIPHIKTFLKYRVFDDSVEIIWIIQGSHNLSNAAWGQLQKNGSQCCIRNFELGVFIHKDQFKFERYYGLEDGEEYPKFVWKRRSCSFNVDTHNNLSDELLTVPLPFKLPPERYTNNDHPWNIELLI